MGERQMHVSLKQKLNQIDSDLSNPHNLLKSLQQIRHSVVKEGTEIFHLWQEWIERENFIPSAQNLAFYLALRRQDLRKIQLALMPWGLSSLGRIEARVLENLDAVIATLGHICGHNSHNLPDRIPLEAFFAGDEILSDRTEEVFGTIPMYLPRQFCDLKINAQTSEYYHRQVRIMVTLPTVAADNYQLVLKLLQSGSDCFRINCARDNLDIWSRAIDNIRKAELETGRSCKILMDLAGPKIRIGRVLYPSSQKRIFLGDTLLLTAKPPQKRDRKIFQANCTLPEILEQLTIGTPVWIDDGKIGAVVKSILPQGVELEITRARFKGEKLNPDKGINFPDTAIDLNPLTSKDRQDLDFIAQKADLIGYSFVQKATDIELLQLELQMRLGNKWREKAIVAKIETPEAIKNLPELIVRAAGKQPFAVMIARGDLAVEIGYQRLAEMQEEILWLCEAAHIPVIWATQVLENLVKKGIPSRAEITDAAMAERAECVMLNKGRFIVEAVTILDDVLTRMEAHQRKKTPQLRALKSW